MVDTTKHPVWTVYDALRGVRLNCCYYTERLASVQKTSLALEIALAISAPASAIGGLWLWNTPVGQPIWKFLLVFSAVAAVIKPLLRLADQAKHLDIAATAYRLLNHDLGDLKAKIEQDGRFDSMHKLLFDQAMARERSLLESLPPMRERRKLKAECEARVRSELSLAAFFIPEDKP